MAKQIELVWPEKQPGAELDYSLDIASEVEPGDDVTSIVAMIRPSGAGELAIKRLGNGPTLYLIKDNDPQTGIPRFIITTWLADGIPGRGNYILRLEVTLASGRVLDILGLVPMSETLAVSPIPDPISEDFSDPVVWNGVQPAFYNLAATILAVTSSTVSGSGQVRVNAS